MWGLTAYLFILGLLKWGVGDASLVVPAACRVIWTCVLCVPGCGSPGCECGVTLVSINLHMVPGVWVLAPRLSYRINTSQAATGHSDTYATQHASWELLQLN